MKANWILGASALTLLFAQGASAKPEEIPIEPPAPTGKCVVDDGPCANDTQCSVASICYQSRCVSLGSLDCTSQAECGGPLCVAMAGTCGAGCAEGYTCESGYCLQSLNPTVESSDAGAEASCDGGACEDVGGALDAGTGSECTGVECESGEPVPSTDEPEAQPTTAAPTGSGDEATSDTTSDGDDMETEAKSSSNCSAAPGSSGSRLGMFALLGLAGLVSRRRR